MAAEKAIRDDYYQTMFWQFERTRGVTAITACLGRAAAYGGGVKYDVL